MQKFRFLFREKMGNFREIRNAQILGGENAKILPNKYGREVILIMIK